MTDANSPEIWDRLWQDTDRQATRFTNMRPLYDRILALLPEGATVVDLGSGPGHLLSRAREERKARRTIAVDCSDEALRQARAAGHDSWWFDLFEEGVWQPHFLPLSGAVVVCTEFLEHMPGAARTLLLEYVSDRPAFFTVPDDCLGPEREPQHTRQFTAVEFKQLLEQYWQHVRVECIQAPNAPYLLGVCGEPAKKPYRLSVTLPVRDEEHDLARVLASFRGAADEIVVGVDPRTKDRTREVAAKYAEVVFDLDSPQGPPGEEQPGENPIHFAHVRNQCTQRCTGDWIFMTEGHEALAQGQDVLLALDRHVPRPALTVAVCRETWDHAWLFPWLYRRDPRVMWKNPVHNVLSSPDDALDWQLPEVVTYHDRPAAKDWERTVQRRGQNAQTLLQRVLRDPRDTRSMFYLAQEYRTLGRWDRVVYWLERYLSRDTTPSPQRYQARLSLARAYIAQREPPQKVYDVLIGASADDWSRTEHWIYLGDLCQRAGMQERALRFYEIAATGIGRRPAAFMWIDKSYYTYLPAQKLVTQYAELGLLDEAVAWARRVEDLLPSWAPEAAREEARQHVLVLEKALRQRSSPEAVRDDSTVGAAAETG